MIAGLDCCSMSVVDVFACDFVSVGCCCHCVVMLVCRVVVIARLTCCLLPIGGVGGICHGQQGIIKYPLAHKTSRAIHALVLV